VNVDTHVRELTEDDLSRIRAVIEGQGEIEGDLRKRIQMDIKPLDGHRGAYRGLRHRTGTFRFATAHATPTRDAAKPAPRDDCLRRKAPGKK